jgi:hypothetical protein
MDLGEVRGDDVDWIGLAQDRNRWRALVNSLLNLLSVREVDRPSLVFIDFNIPAFTPSRHRV